MSRGVNKVILVGHLGGDPEVRYSASGTAMTTVSIATSDNWMDKQTNQLQTRTEWHRVVMFARLAEIAGQYLRKGSQIYIEGRLQTRKWQDQTGTERYTTEIVANEMQMLGGRGENAPNMPPDAGQQGNQGYAPTAPAASSAAPAAAGGYGGGSGNNYNYPPSGAPAAPARNPSPTSSPPPSDFDDDIPF